MSGFVCGRLTESDWFVATLTVAGSVCFCEWGVMAEFWIYVICFPWVALPLPLTTEVTYPPRGGDKFCFLFVVSAV